MPETRRQQLRLLLAEARQRSLVCPQPPLSAFAEALHRWALEGCCFRDHCYGGVIGLHNAYVRWCGKGACEVPCPLTHFRQWLSIEGFCAESDRFVHGFVLKDDVEELAAYAQRQRPCEKGEKSEKRLANEGYGFVRQQQLR